MAGADEDRLDVLLSLSDAVVELPGVVGPGAGVGDESDGRGSRMTDVLASGVPSAPEGRTVVEVVIDDGTLDVGR